MAHPNLRIRSSVFSSELEAFILEIFVFFLLFLPHANSVTFNFTNFKENGQNIVTRNGSYVDGDGVLQLTKNGLNTLLNVSAGRASYSQAVLLWDNTTTTTNTKQVTNFTTHFQFKINFVGNDRNLYGDGITFFLAPFDNTTESAPFNSVGGCLGLITQDQSGFCNTSSNYPFVAVEFDTFMNSWDPPMPSDGHYNDHLGIDVNSVDSKSTNVLSTIMKTTATANAWITYNSATNNLSVFLTYADKPVFVSGIYNLSYVIDLSTVLPEKVRVGFSASTGANAEIHEILSWEFNSTLPDRDNTHSQDPAFAPSIITNQPSIRQNTNKTKVGLVAGIVGGVGVLMLVLGLCGLMWWPRRSSHGKKDVDFEMDDDEFENGTGPRKFTYRELRRATNNFAEEGKLGEGGFGGVYIGFLTDPSREIAVKKIKRESKQGQKEYVSEVKIISRLRHRNLVQLLGWCHDQGELLLVYEFMPNGSLDSHLYGGKMNVLSWDMRYKIAVGLASALLYLHEEWEQCVVHRDIKSSNVMLDSNFNAKLGDFGLARLVDHNLGSQTTVLAGTLGYLAPECANTGKASKESDVYSFGVVALEIACGRRPVEIREEANKVRMVEWVWDLYGKGLLLEAVDRRLEGEFDMQQVECLMVVGLWCSHPDYSFRPSIRQVLNVLNFEVPVPKLPSKYPVPIYSPAMNMDVFSITSSSGFTGSSGTSNASSQSVASGSAPLLPQNATN